MLKHTLYFIIILLLTSCNFFGGNKITRNEMDQECLSDTSDYFVLAYNIDNSIKLRGFISQLKRNGEWIEWYSDGEIRNTILYDMDTIIVDSIREHPKIFFTSDSFKVGVKSYIRMVGLYPFEELKCDGDAELTKVLDNSEYDYEVVPSSTDSLIFFYYKEGPLNHKLITNYAQTLRNNGLAESDSSKLANAETLAVKVFLKKVPVYK